MPLVVNGTTVKALKINSTTCKTGICNGVTIFTSSIPSPIYNGSNTISEIGGWSTTQRVYESSTWNWDSSRSSYQMGVQGSGGLQFTTYCGAAGNSRGGCSIYSTNKLDLSGNKTISVVAGRNGNTYLVTGSGANSDYVYFSVWLTTAINSNPVAFASQHCAKGWGVYTKYTLTLTIPSNTAGVHLGFSAFDTGNEGNVIMLYSITTTS